MAAIIYNTLFLCFLLALFALQKPSTIAASYILAGAYYVVAKNSVTIKTNDLLVWAIVTLICMLAVVNYNHGATSFFYLMVTPLILLSAKQFASQSHDRVILCLKLFYWVFVLGVAYGLAQNWEDPEPLGAIFEGSSTNALPSYLIVIQLTYSLAFYLKYNRFPIFSSISTLVVAIFGLGRGSMIVAALIVLLSVIVNIVSSKTDRRTSIRLVALSVFPLIYYLYINYAEIQGAIEDLYEGSKFAAGIIDEHRERMLIDYLGKIDGWTFIFGTDYSGTSIVQYYGGNPHNSFIRAHSFYGLMGLMLIITPLLLIVLSKRIISHKVIAISLFSLALLRASTEPIFFPTTLDFFYLLSCFIYFRFSTIVQRNSSCCKLDLT